MEEEAVLIEPERMKKEYHNGISLVAIAESRNITVEVARAVILGAMPQLQRKTPHAYEKTSVGMIKYKRVMAKVNNLEEENRLLKLRVEQLKGGEI